MTSVPVNHEKRLLAHSIQLAQIRHLEKLSAYALQAAFEFIDAEYGLLILTHANDRPDLRIHRDKHGEHGESRGFYANQSIIDEALNTGETLVVKIGTNDHLSAMCIPLRTDQSSFGVIYLEGRAGVDRIAKDKLELLDFLATHTAIAIENALRNDDLASHAAERAHALQESKRRYQALFEHANDGVFILNTEGVHIVTNQRAADMLGYEFDELVGKTIQEMVAPEDYPQAVQNLEAILTGVTLPIYERTFIRKDGSPLPAEINATLVYDNTGAPQHIQSIVRDISERKRAEQAIKESEERYRSLVEDMPILVCRFYLDGTLSFVNDAYAQYFKKDKLDLVGYNFFQLIPEDEREDARAHLKALTLQQPVKTYEHRAYTAERGLRWQHWTDRAIFDKNGEVVEFQSVGQDITERKQAEQTLEKQKQLFENLVAISRATTERPSLKSTLENALNAIIPLTGAEHGSLFLLDPSGNIIESILTRDHAPPLEKTIILDQVMETGAAGYVAQHRIPLLIDDTCQDERWITLTDQPYSVRSALIVPIIKGLDFLGILSLTHSSPNQFREEDKQLILAAVDQMALALRNAQIYEHQRQLVHHLREARKEADAANRAKSVFLANMSHELRTPLNSILGFNELLSQSAVLSETQREMIAINQRSSEHLLALVNDLLDFSVIESGQTEIILDDCHLPNLLRGIEEMFYLRAETKGLSLTFELAPDIPTVVRVDARKLRQILINLLGNALKFTEQGGVIFSVRCKSDPNYFCMLQCIIQDTGIGIAENELTNIFDPFTKSKNTQNFPDGVGLGLPISREYARAMGGDLCAESQIDKGTTFILTIPVEVSTMQKPVTALRQPDKQIVRLADGQPKYRILITEDIDANRRLLMHILQPLGFELRQAQNGQEAVEMWSQWHPDAVLMDIRMPVMDGLEAIKRIKALPQGDKTVFIALAASNFEEDRHAILHVAGYDEFIPKPFRRQDVLNALITHLGVEFEYRDICPETTPPIESCVTDMRGQQPSISADLPHAFTRSVIHDLKNPLSVIVGCADMLVTDRERMQEETIHKIIYEILNNGHKLNAMLEALTQPNHIAEKRSS